MKSTFSRTFITISVLLLVALLIIGISFQLLVRNYLVETTVDSLKNDATVISQLVQSIYSDSDLSKREFNMALGVATSVSGSDAVICDENGVLLLCAQSPLGCEHQGLQLDKNFLARVYQNGMTTDTGVIQGLYTNQRFVVSVPVFSEQGQRLGVVIVSAPMEKTLETLRRISEIFLFVSLLVVLFAVAVATLFARHQAAPLRDMAKTARAFGHGELTARVNTDGKNTQEVEDLALAFNNMASSLQKSEYQRQEFVANVSHELKTPMTTISGYIDGILDGTIPEERQAHYLRIVSDETKRLNRLVRSMLDISRLQNQGGIPDEQKSRFDLLECMGKVLITFEQKINEKQLDVQVDFPEHPVYTFAGEDALTQIIYNLLDNAVKFSPAGSTLTLSIRENGKKAYLSISNQGQTIPAEELPLVFDRFHKMDKSRSKNRDSWGLGLYIVKTLVDSHGENISVTSRENTTTFTFTMPVVV